MVPLYVLSDEEEEKEEGRNWRAEKILKRARPRRIGHWLFYWLVHSTTNLGHGLDQGTSRMQMASGWEQSH